METSAIKKSIIVNNCEFILRENNRVYWKVTGFVVTTLNVDKIYLDKNKETEIDMCIKDINADTPISFYCTDSRDGTYDVIVTNTSMSDTTFKVFCVITIIGIAGMCYYLF